MGEIDRQSKLFFGKNERFADLVNATLYQGNQTLNSEDLEELDTELNESVQRRRDLLKRCRTDGTVYMVLGAEMQSSIDETMPLRVMEYDVFTYLKMIQKDKKISPLASFVLYTGERPWDKPMSLYEMMDIPDKLKPIVQNYEIKVFHALDLDKELFQNRDVREFFELFQDTHFLGKDELIEKYRHKQLKSVDAVETAAVLGKCDDLRKLIVKTEEGFTMCTNFDRIVTEIKEEGREQGRELGRKEGIQEGIQEGIKIGADEATKKEKISVIEMLLKMGMDLSQIAMVVRLAESDVQKIASTLGLTV